MRLKVKDMDIATGGILVVLINQKDAEKYDLHAMDRVMVTKGKHSETALIDIAESNRVVPPGSIGLFEEILKHLKVKDKANVEIKLEKKPESIEYIKEKLDGKRLDYKKIKQIIEDIIQKKLTDIELTTFVTSPCSSNLIKES